MTEPPEKEPESPSRNQILELPNARFWLRFGDHDVELPQGETVLGRSVKCQLVIDDPLVSRSHARIVVNGSRVGIEDLGSANGVLVNGERLAGTREIVQGDRVALGQQSFELYVAAPSDRPKRDERMSARTLSGLKSSDVRVESQDVGVTDATRRGDALDLLAGVAEKVLSLGRGEEAERILATYLRNFLLQARQNGSIEPELAEKAATYAVRLGEATGKGSWIDYVFELYTVAKKPLSTSVVDRLYGSMRKVGGVSVHVFREYVSTLRQVESNFGPSERFLLRRTEGLESLGAFR